MIQSLRFLLNFKYFFDCREFLTQSECDVDVKTRARMSSMMKNFSLLLPPQSVPSITEHATEMPQAMMHDIA